MITLDEAEDHPIRDAKVCGDLLRRLASAHQIARLVALSCGKPMRSIGWWRAFDNMPSRMHSASVFAQHRLDAAFIVSFLFEVVQVLQQQIADAMRGLVFQW